MKSPLDVQLPDGWPRMVACGMAGTVVHSESEELAFLQTCARCILISVVLAVALVAGTLWMLA